MTELRIMIFILSLIAFLLGCIVDGDDAQKLLLIAIYLLFFAVN
jgi:hypothetical protein